MPQLFFQKAKYLLASRKNISIRVSIYILIFFSLGFTSLAQTIRSHPVAITPHLRETILFNDSVFRQKTFNRYKDKFRLKSRLYDFTKLNTGEMQEIFNSNAVYSNLVNETEYLRKVAARTIPIGYLDDQVKIYIVRDPSFNAFCREDGSIFVYIGLLAKCNNEAELASVLSHEFGHYYSKHSLKRYKKTMNSAAINASLNLFGGIFGSIAAKINKLKYYHERRTNEKESDLFAVSFFEQNHYAYASIISFQEAALNDISVSRKRKGHIKYPGLYKDHPSSERRIQRIKKYVKPEMMATGKKFQVDSLTFLRVKKRAVDECIYLNFSTGKLDACIEMAYLNYICHTDDEFYLYFLMEALRRKTDLFPATKTKNFITENFNLKATGSGIKKQESLSIHNQLEQVYGAEFKIKRKELNLADTALIDPHSIEFISNAEALTYFTKAAEGKCMGCYATLKNMGKNFSIPQRESQSSDLETMLYDQTFLAAEDFYGNGKEICYPFFINNYYSAVRGKKRFYFSPISQTSGMKEEISRHNNSAERDNRNPCDELTFLPELNFREIYQVTPALSLISQKLVRDNKKNFRKKHVFTGSETVLKTFVNIESDFPELTLIARKYHFKKLYFTDVLLNRPNPNYHRKTVVGAQIYCLDFTTNIVSRFSYTYKPGSWNDITGYYGTITESTLDVFNKTKGKP